jgi:uncharacterized repeat protein (TIGR01451 family)
VIQGNLIGLGADGTTPLGNAADGVATLGNTLVGGPTAAARNIISANGRNGVYIFDGRSSQAVIENDYIGTDSHGLLPRGNDGFGVAIDGTSNNTIGGSAATGNVIAANGATKKISAYGLVPGGIVIAGGQFASAGNLVEGNRIGVGADGSTPLGNLGPGLFINGANNNPVVANTIAFNNTANSSSKGGGVSVNSGNPAVGNTISANAIYSNAGLGIDLGNDGVTPNTSGGPHAGPNDLQNFPVITLVKSLGGGAEIHGTLNSTPSTQFTLEFFASSAADSSGYGQGQTFLASRTVSTDASGNVTFDFNLPSSNSAEPFITATATDPNGNTSEFSADFQQSAPAADLQVSIKSAAPNPALVNQTYSYTVTVTNAGPQDATNVILTDDNGEGAYVYSATSSGTVTDVSRTETAVRFARLAAGASVTATFGVRSAQAGTYTDTARVQSDQSDPDPTNNQATFTETVVAQPLVEADLSITGSVSPASATVGGNLTYTLTIANYGPRNASGVIVTDILPAGVVFVSATASHGGGVSQTQGTITVNLNGLAENDKASVSIVVIPTDVSTLINIVRVTADQPDPDSANNSVTLVTLVGLSAPTNVFGSLLNTSPNLYALFITWGYPPAVDGVATFNVYRSTSPGGEGPTPLASAGAGHRFVDSAVRAGTTYYYQVTALINGVESARSVEIRVTDSLIPGVLATSSRASRSRGRPGQRAIVIPAAFIKTKRDVPRFLPRRAR